MKKKDGYAKVTLIHLNWQGAMINSTVVMEFYHFNWMKNLLYEFEEMERRRDRGAKDGSSVGSLLSVEIWNAEEKKFTTYRTYRI